MTSRFPLAGVAAASALALATLPASASPIGLGVAIPQASGLTQTVHYDGYGEHGRRWWRWGHRHDEGRGWGWRQNRWDRFHGRRDTWNDRRGGGDRGWRRD